ncbi:MFS transporter [Streptomonospora nanhaiensis]|nr:MFS transporter [Streptomonospora nanhaiensis]
MGVREFQALWVAQALSMTGNFLLSVAVTILVYQQTASALAAGVTLALTFVPQIIAGPLLSGLADLFPRRRVIVVCDIIRAALVASIGIPGMPIWGIWVLLFCSILPMVPFAAARAALMAEIVHGDRYVAASAIIQLTTQVGTLVGLAAGGWVVALIGPNSAVMYNGLTFLASAAIIQFGVRFRPAAHEDAEERPSLWRVTRDGTRLVFGDSRLRTLGLFAWLAGIYMMPYGLANPIADEVGAGPTAAGFIMAGHSMGAVVGGFVLTRLINPATRMRLMGPMAVAASAPLLAWFLHPPLWLMVVLLAVSGMAASYQFVANAAFVLCVPPEGRGLAFGLVAAGLQAVQGIGIALASLLVEVASTHVVITGAGIAGVLAAAALALPWARIAQSAIDRMNTGAA